MKCGHCQNLSYHGIRRDGWPSTVYEYCDHYGHGKPLDCALFLEGEPRYFDKHGVEMTICEVEAILDKMCGDA